MTDTQTPAGWYSDPTNPGQLRWWSGSEWTQDVRTLAPPSGAAIVEAATVPAKLAGSSPLDSYAREGSISCAAVEAVHTFEFRSSTKCSVGLGETLSEIFLPGEVPQGVLSGSYNQQSAFLIATQGRVIFIWGDGYGRGGNHGHVPLHEVTGWEVVPQRGRLIFNLATLSATIPLENVRQDEINPFVFAMDHAYSALVPPGLPQDLAPMLQEFEQYIGRLDDPTVHSALRHYSGAFHRRHRACARLFSLVCQWPGLLAHRTRNAS